MKITKESNHLLHFFVENGRFPPLEQSKKIHAVLKKLYDEIKMGVTYIHELKLKKGETFYKMKMTRITNVEKIPKPSTFPENAFPSEVKKHIDKHSMVSLTYTFHLFKRNISIIFLIEESHVEKLIKTYNNYVDYMLVWLYMIDIHSSKKCVNQLKIFVYHTSLLKNLPKSNNEILNENNVNTAFTRTCPSNSEIVIFRKEEWFKVFIHETFHNFGLDFSNMNMSTIHKKIFKLFPVNSNINLYEAYAEFWARMVNVLFCSFIYAKTKNDRNAFYEKVDFFINFERQFAFFQMVKILNFMGLTYQDLYKKTALSEKMRRIFYKEDTNVLSYYVITLILLNNCYEFLLWCDANNASILNFKKTEKTLDNFCKFIEKNYKSEDLLYGIECTNELLDHVKKTTKGNYLTKTLRMTLCELG